MRGKKKTYNNHGSTLITVLVVVAFIAILGTVSTSMAMVNYKMKMVDKKSKSTFYTAEEAVDEIYTGLGITSMECLDEAYRQEMANIIKQEKELGVVSSSKQDNPKSNLSMRKHFTQNFLYAVFDKNETTEPNLWGTDDAKVFAEDTYKTALKNHLNSYLSKSEKATVKSVGEITLAKKTSPENGIAIYTVTMKECVVEYVTDSEGYFAEVSFDSVTELPDTMVQFTGGSSSSIIDKMNMYNLIGSTGIRLDEGKKVTLNNTSVFAGGGAVSEEDSGGFNLWKNSSLTVNSSMMVTSGDITVDSAQFTANSSDSDLSRIWCKNLIAKNTGKDVSPKISVNKCQTYVKDDLQIDGDGMSKSDTADVTISGEYYGYSYEGNNTANSHNASSAIALNGTNSKLDITGITSLMLGGRAYVDFKNSNSYMTGQSLALKGDQEVYLVPSTFIKNKNDQTKFLGNPYSKTAEAVFDLQNFFGYTCLDLSDSENNSFIKKVEVSNKYYVYFVFASKEKATQYFKAILNDDAYAELVKSGGADKNAALLEAYDSSRNYMRNILEQNMTALSQSITNVSGANIFTNGALIYADSASHKIGSIESSNSYDVPGYGSYDGFGLNAIDISNRYAYLSKVYYEPEWYKSDGNRNIQFTTGEMSSTEAANTVFENVVNKVYLDNRINAGELYPSDITGGYVKIISAGDFVVKDNMKYGVIIAKGDVIVETDEFHGAIISDKNIIFKNTSTVIDGKIPGSTSIEDYIKGDSAFAMYFRKFNSAEFTGDSDTPLSIGDVSYRDIVKLQNWRKN